MLVLRLHFAVVGIDHRVNILHRRIPTFLLYNKNMSTKISAGTVHKLPADLRKALAANKKVLVLWENITPLARNEYICWVENAKQIETRKRRIQRTYEELLEGKRRPCCWLGCIHRKDKSVSKSVKWVLSRQSKNAS